MAKFLFTAWPFAGHVHPCMAVAHALRARGHEVGFFTGSSVRSMIEGEGFRCFPFREINEERVCTIASSEFVYCASRWQQLRHAKQLQAKFREWLLDTIPQQVTDVEAVLKTWSPDVLVTDLAFWSPILLLHELKSIPVAVMSITAACMLPGADVPVWGQGTPRPRTGWMRFRSLLGHKLLEWVSVGFRSEVNAMRRRYGLPAISVSVTQYAAHMPLYLVPSTPEYDYQRRDLPISVQYVGPCLWDKASNAPAPEWLAKLPVGQPLIYVTEATIGTQEPFLLRAAAQALRDLPVQVVMTTGKQRKPEELNLGPAAPNIRVVPYVPQSDLLPRMAVMVTLGGSGGVLAALKAGIPLVVVPTEWDRPENAQRVVEAGAGIRIAAKLCTPECLRHAVEQVLKEPSYRQNAQRLAKSFAEFEGPLGAAKLLEGLLPASVSKSAEQEAASRSRHVVLQAHEQGR